MPAGPNESPERQDWSDAALDAEPVLSHRVLYRLGWIAVAVLVIVLLTVLPPLINVSHYQRRVAQAITASIGRPVHFDQIHLHLLPLPGLTIQNFVVQEDPAFGTEPALRANTVEARLRLSSLWRRRIEVSHITLQAPSINLVRREDGRWSLQGIVTEAGHLQNAPTVQGRAGAAPRFPYIEATDARINFKAANHKLPWSLVDAKLALWLPDPAEWRVRLRGRPVRTDTDVSDVGDLELEGSLGRGASGAPGGVLDQPLAVSAHWASTPLGEAAKLLIGRDTDFRGAASAELEVRGTPAHMRLSSEMHLHNLRRAEFVPRLPMSLDAQCQAEALGIVHALQNVRCAIPTAQSSGLLEGVFRSRDQQLSAAPSVALLQASIPDILHPETAAVSVNLKRGSPEYVLDWLRILSSRIPESATVTGSFGLQAGWNTGGKPEYWNLQATCECTLSPAFSASPIAAQNADVGETSGSAAGPGATSDGTVPTVRRNAPWFLRLTRVPVQTGPDSLQPGSTDVVLSAGREIPQPVTTDPHSGAASVAGAQPTPAEDALPATPDHLDPLTEINGTITSRSAALRYATPRLAHYVATLFPPLGDNLPSAFDAASSVQVPLQSERIWGQPQTWMASAPPPAPAKPRRRSRHETRRRSSN